MAKRQLEVCTYQPDVGGLYVFSGLKDHLQTEVRMTLDFGSLQSSALKRLVNVLRQGFDTSVDNDVANILRLLAEHPEAPKVPEVGYVGKREMRVLVAESMASRYRDELIAAGHLLDVDISKAANVVGSKYPSLSLIRVAGYQVKVSGASKAPAYTVSGRKNPVHLRPATSKLTGMIRQWGLEILHYRQPLIDYINAKPRLEWTLKHNC